jgi:beta-glucanase (GH16 family)
LIAGSDSQAGYVPYGYSNLAFEDEFKRLDRNVWSLRGLDPWGDGMPHADTSYDACSISGEKLRMRLLHGSQTSDSVLTGNIGTMNSFLFQYGYAEAKMRFYPYHGMHASFWLQSPGPYEVGAPEIDVVEYFGAHNPERKSGINVYSNVYYRNEPGDIQNKKIVTNSRTFGANWYKDWHTYGVAVSPSGYAFFIDNKLTGMITGVTDTSKKYLVLYNLVRDYEYPYIAEHPFDTYKTSVEYVRVWQ